MITLEDIEKAIKLYKADIKKFPIFFEPNKIELLDSQFIRKQVLNKLNENYQPNLGNVFYIPYNQIATRKVVSLEVEDVIIRYIIISKLKEMIILNQRQVFDIKDKPYSVLIDIEDCYQSINHNLLISIVKAYCKIDEDSLILKLLRSSLKVSYFENSKLINSESGVLIGSKPDEFLAEIFLTYIERLLIKKITKNIQRINDEFLICAYTIKEAREFIQEIRTELENLGIKINLAKIEYIEHSPTEFIKENFLELVVKREFHGSPSNPYIFLDTNFVVKTKSKGTVKNSEKDISNDNDILSYKDSIIFLKDLYKNYTEVANYQKKYPAYKRFINIVASKPTDFYNDYLNLNFEILDIDKLNKLIKIIVKYPKSEYYSAIAIKILVFVAKEFIYDINYTKRAIPGTEPMDYGNSTTVDSKKFTAVCEFANLKIFELLKSNQIFDYQKYLILRYLYSNSDGLDISFKNYKIETDGRYNWEYDYKIEAELPFYEIIKNELKIIKNETQHFALISIIQHLFNGKV